MKIQSNTHLCLSIVATGRCNCNCSYCHFYASHDRSLYNRDIEYPLFKRYVQYIKYMKTITPYISCRLSGGEPLVMGKRIFEMTDYIANETGISPYIMTNGKLLSLELISEAYRHHVSAFVISVENPLSVSPGAVDAMETIEKFAKLQSTKVPLYFGMIVLENSQFKNIKKIADIFYKKTGTLPPMCEINYLPYASPTEEEFQELYENVRSVVKEYNGKAALSLFPYVIPEYYSGNQKGTEYLTELPIDDKHGMLTRRNEEILPLTEIQIDRSYFPYDCRHKNCDWYDSCKYIKWVWNMDTEEISAVKKMHDYCIFKKKLGQAFFDALILGD